MNNKKIAFITPTGKLLRYDAEGNAVFTTCAFDAKDFSGDAVANAQKATSHIEGKFVSFDISAIARVDADLSGEWFID
jgi:hypothetical protein